jgi:hypothetical protein
VNGASFGPLDPATYGSHALHAGERAFPLANCYVDLWIEVLHALGADPFAMLPFTLSSDFEGDQWTFFKPPLADLLALYGIDVQELNVWGSLEAHVHEQISLGRVVVVEADAFFLPDTAGTGYGAEHTKTAIAVRSIDLGAERLGYFHNGGYYELSGGDFRGVFRLDEAPGASLPPYVELAKIEGFVRRPEGDLVERSVLLLQSHVARRPRTNPIARFADRFGGDLAWLTRGDLSAYHRYAFATLRQCGACYELAALYLGWLAPRTELHLSVAAAELASIADRAKTLMFKTARAVNARRALEFEPNFAAMGSSWETAMSSLDAVIGA